MNTKKLKTVVLVGNPNVGKSSLFYRLTGTHVITGNFPGTTLSVTRGTLSTHQKNAEYSYEIIDLPGMYSLTEHTGAMTKGALFVLSQADIIINVIDSTQLKRNLYLHLQLKTLGKPTIIALNLYDEAGYHGIHINTDLLSTRLSCPVIPTVSISGNGIPALVKAISSLPSTTNLTAQPSSRPNWQEITEHVTTVQRCTKRRKTFLEHLTTLSVHPVWGAILALIVFGSTLAALFALSSSLEFTILSLFNFVLEQPLQLLHALCEKHPFLRTFLIGDISQSPIDFENAMGILTTGLYIPLGQVAPPVIAFYATMGLLEDSGYLPRIAYVADTLMHRYALHGAAIIPMLMGAGCNVTGIIGTRILENRQQRIIAATLIAIAVPCASQTGFIVAMAVKMGPMLLTCLIISLIVLWHLIGLILGVQRRNNYPELIMEMPPLRLPRWRPSLRKLAHRVKNFLSDAIPITIIGIGIVLLLTHTGILTCIAQTLFGWTHTLWGLPQETVPALCMGLFRKEIALTFLRAVPSLTQAQAFTATLILTLWFPCVSVYAILYKEFGFRTVCLMALFMALVSSITGIIAHMVLTTFWI
ncbi:MAG: ferrous iron transport protein [Candidatus Dependentiae bacterium]|nr:ferrous iron transport protein [Candidatus Dependentiae bacterium]